MMEISLIELCARICFYAQQHSGDEDAWGPRSSHTLDRMMEPTSFVVSCFIAQNTEFGSEGVEWAIVHKELAGPVLSYDKWLKVIEEKVSHFEDPKVRLDFEGLIANLDKVYQEWRNRRMGEMADGSPEVDEI